MHDNAINEATHEPTDGTTLSEVLDDYLQSGFSTTFAAEPGGSIRCGECQSNLDASRFVMHSQRRLEGASDPADMLTVVATSCPVCGSDGTMVLGYGPMAASEDADAFTAMTDQRHDDRLPQNATPADLPDDMPSDGG